MPYCPKLRYLLGTACLAATFVRREWSHSTPADTTHSGAELIESTIQPWDNNWDVGHAQVKPTINSDQVFPRPYNKLLIFVRHGQYHVKAKTRDEKVLTDLGWKQAYETGRQLKRAGIRIDRIIHSDMIRARQTTAALLMGLQDDCDHLFDTQLLTNLATPEQIQLHGNYARSDSDDEHPSSSSSSSDVTMCCQQMIGKPYQPYATCSFVCQQSRFLAEGPPPVAPEPPISKTCDPDVRQKEGARLEEGFQAHIHHIPIAKQDQVLSFDYSDSTNHCVLPHDINYVQSNIPGETIVFVGHANVFRYWLCRALQLPPEAWLRISLHHGSLTSLLINYEPSNEVANSSSRVQSCRCIVSALQIGEIGHFPKEFLSR